MFCRKCSDICVLPVSDKLPTNVDPPAENDPNVDGELSLNGLDFSRLDGKLATNCVSSKVFLLFVLCY